MNYRTKGAHDERAMEMGDYHRDWFLHRIADHLAQYLKRKYDIAKNKLKESKTLSKTRFYFLFLGKMNRLE